MSDVNRAAIFNSESTDFDNDIDLSAYNPLTQVFGARLLCKHLGMVVDPARIQIIFEEKISATSTSSDSHSLSENGVVVVFRLIVDSLEVELDSDAE